uniref:Piwi domain-containing protein n=1 Tax=Panagrolaimus superbus TaxID=310955 RepID=A0A914Z6I6_9BILA
MFASSRGRGNDSERGGGFRGGRGGEHGGRGGGFADRGGRGGDFADRRGRGSGFGDHGIRGSFGDRGGRGSTGDRGNRGSFGDRGGRGGGFGDRGARGGFRGGFDVDREGRGRGRGDQHANNGLFGGRVGGYGNSNARLSNERQHQEYKCLASQFKIVIGPKSYVFNYELEINHQLADDAGDRMISKKCDRELCRHLVQKICNFNDIDYVYDGQMLLWSNQKLAEPLEYICVADEFDDYMKSKLRNEGTLYLKLKFVAEYNLSDFDQYMTGTNTNGERRTQRNVCELILSGSAINRGEFTCGGIGSLYDVLESPFHGLVTREGNSKGVHVIQWDEQPQLIMSLEYSNKLFYPSGQLFGDLVDNLINDRWTMAELDKLFSGVKFALTYNPSRIITFEKFTTENVRQLRVGEISMCQWFSQEKDIQLSKLDKKGVVAKLNDKSKYRNIEIFPLDVLRILPNQSVPNLQLPEKLNAKALEINRLKTKDRYERIMIQHAKLGLNTNDSLCNAFGLSVSSEMISGPFSRLPKSVVMVRNNQQLTVKDDGSFCFERNQYLIPAHIKQVVVIASKRNEKKSMECIGHISREANNKGMIIGNIRYQEFDIDSTDFTEWVRVFQNFKGCFVIAIDGCSDSHSLLKIAGAINDVSTQHVHWETAKLVSTGGRGQTRENIVHQMNIKSNGLNHKVLFDHDVCNLNLDGGNVFVIGLDVCHGGTTGNYFRDSCSTVGLVSNYLDDPNSFSGTFFYQRSRQEIVDSSFLHVSVRQMLQKNPRREKINTIVILRDGVSEGQYSMVTNSEVSAIKKAANEVYGHPNIRIVCIIVTKNGNARHFDITNRYPTSLPPRSVVTFGCRFGYNQFYLVPHRAFQGTAKAVMCTVLQDDLGCNEIEIQKFILGLTNLHQIVCAPISLPEPVNMADSLAQRGYEIFAALKQYSPQQIPRDENGFIKLPDLSYYLGYNFGNSQ